MHIQSIYTNYNYYCTELTIDVMSQISYTLIHHQHHDTTKSNPFFYLFQRLKQLNLSFKAIKWKWHLYVSVIPSHTGIPLLTPTSFIRKSTCQREHLPGSIITFVVNSDSCTIPQLKNQCTKSCPPSLLTSVMWSISVFVEANSR